MIHTPWVAISVASVDSDTMLIDDPDLNEVSDFSKNTHENKGLFGVLTMIESFDLHVSHGDFALQIESKDASGNRLLDTERERGKRRFCDQCRIVDVKEKSTEQY